MAFPNGSQSPWRVISGGLWVLILVTVSLQGHSDNSFAFVSVIPGGVDVPCIYTHAR